MRFLVLLLTLAVAITSLSVTPISPNPYLSSLSSACRKDMEDNLLNINGYIVPRWYYSGKCLHGKRLETSCKYLQAITQDHTNCVVQVSGNCQRTDGSFSPGAYELIHSTACCKWFTHPIKPLKILIKRPKKAEFSKIS